jgi:ankyrin repeat protein
MGTPIHYVVSMYTHGRLILTHGTRYLALQDLLHGLASRGVSIDATDSRGDTALHYAAARTLQTNEIMVRGLVAELLIMLGARYTIANANGRTVRQLMPEHSWMFTASNIKRQRHGSANTRQTKKVKR